MENNKKIISEMKEVINKNIIEEDFIIFGICGDIFDKGDLNEFNETKDFFDKLLKDIKSKNTKLVLCPGNHDIILNSKKIKSFEELDKLIFKLTGNTDINYQRGNVNLITIDDIDFILINSSYHLNHEYGKIDLNDLNKILRTSKNNKIILIHHHMIPIREGEKSTIVNSYEFLKTLENEKVLAILHGHQHMKMGITIGENLCRVIGVGSLLTDISTNYNNQFNMINVENGKIEKIIEYKYNADEMGSVTLGKFIENKI
jgi:DNA repair exonuclease SbcCD nuclease subunit